MKVQIPEGYKVKYEHRRRSYDKAGLFGPGGEMDRGFIKRQGLLIHSKGGKTIAHIYDVNDKLVATGIAECSNNDNFNYRIGRDIALGRALKTAGLLR